MKYYLFIFCIISNLWANSPTNADIQNLYTFEDLKTLTDNKEYDEFFDHFLDLRPSQRDEKWKQLVIKNLNDFLKYSLEAKKFKKENIELLHKLTAYDFFMNDEILVLFSNEYISNLLKQYSDDKNQLDALIASAKLFWEKTGKDDNLALTLFLLNHKNNSSGQDNWPYIHVIVEGKNSIENCKHQQVQSELISKLFNELAKDEKVELNFNYFSRDCLTHLRPKIDQFLISSNEFERKLALNILNSTNEIKPEDKQLYSLIYLLSRPEIGEDFNLAWSEIEKLKNKADERENLLSKVAKLDTLPDKLLVSENQKITTGVYKLLLNSYPEFLDYYYKECLNYYRGTKEFSKGSRTVHCKEFIDLSESQSLLAPAQIEQIKMALPTRNL